MHRHAHNHSHNHSQESQPRGRPVVPEESAKASDCFEQFLTASTLKTILGCYRNICEHLHLKPNALPLFYPKLKTHINSWKAKPLWKKFDTRANQKCYGRGKACPQTRVLIIGGGPCGLRTAIEAQLLGAKVVVVEKRDRMSRNNVLHLWPFVIDDLRALGAKKFFGKFCAGSIDHISIRQLQCILLKVALLLGVEVHTEVRFERILEPNPNEKTGWRAEFKPAEHPVSQFEFDVIIGADGKRNTLQGFKRKEFRGKLAIAITANFINKRTEAEARVEEISGVAFIFNQKFFKDLYAETGIDLENIVYYKDDTHYFVMTAKKQSLIDKGVIKEDLSDTAKLLAPDNVDREELMNYAREAAEFSTNYQMPDLEFAVNHYGHPDVAMFDFTSMYAAENASRVIERHNYKLLSILVGDSLLEPFWPTGSGCARGFLSSMDAAWAIRSWGSDTMTPLEVIAERESIYRLLAQTTPENLNKDYKSYTIEPWTRYPNLNKNVLLAHQVISLYDTDDPKSIELNPRSTPAIVEVPKKRRRESHVDPDTLLSWIKEQIREHEDLEVTNLTTSFRDGRVLCAIISHYRPDLLDYSAINAHDIARNNQVAFDLLEKELGIPPFMSGEEMADNESPDFLTMLGYLTKVYDTFRCEIPHIKYPKYGGNLTIRRTSAVVVPSFSFPLKPLLITPRSSAKVSDEATDYLSSENSLIQTPSVPKTLEAKTQDNLILIPIKSIENYLSKSTIRTMMTPENDDKINVTNQTEIQLEDSKEKICKLSMCKSSKSDPLFPTVTKTKSKVSIVCNKIYPIAKRNSAKSIDQKPPVELYKRKRIGSKRSINRIPLQHSNDAFEEFEPISGSGDRMDDRANIKQPSQKSVDTLRIKIKPSDPNKCTKRTLKVKFSSKSKMRREEIIPNDDKCKILEHVNSKWFGCKTSDDSQTTVAGSVQLTMNFLKEMDLLLERHKLAVQELDKLKHNVDVKIRASFNAPKDIPPILLDSQENQKERKPYPDIVIKNTERKNNNTVAVQVVKFFSMSNCLSIIPRLISSASSSLNLNLFGTKNEVVTSQRKLPPDESIAKVEGWIKSSNFESDSALVNEYNEPLNPEKTNPKNDYDEDTIITSVTKQEWLRKARNANQAMQDGQVQLSSTVHSHESIESMAKLVETLKSNNMIKGVVRNSDSASPWEMYEGRTKSKSEPPDQFSTIIEGEESDMPEVKRNDNVFKIRTNVDRTDIFAAPAAPPARPSSRHKRHVDTSFLNKPSAGLSQDRKARKRRTLEKVGASVEDRQKRLEEIASNRSDRQSKRRQQRKMQTEQFLKSMQMLQSNCKPDHSEPFEDYSIYLYRQTAPNFEDRVKNLEKQFIYVPDKDTRAAPTQLKRETDEDFAARIKDLEEKWREPVSVEKKPKDLLRAIGKIETSDWNIKEIEKKIIENKLGKSVNKDKEKVPKWSREQFLARQNKMERKHLDRQDSAEVKFAEIDKNIKQLEQKLKEGSARDLNQHKVASITEKLVGKTGETTATPQPPPPPLPKQVQKSNSRTVIAINQGSEFCHFCSKRVYLVERLTAEGKIFHTGCFRCQYCNTSLRLGTYMFDREGLYGHRFYCAQHFGMPGEINRPEKKPVQVQEDGPQKKLVTNVFGVDLLDRVQTPERIEFSNLSTGHVSSDHDESPSPIDEDEWTDRNNINSVIDSDSSDDSSSASDTDTDDEAYEEALEEPITKEGTLRWAERYKKRYSHKDDDSMNSDGYSSSDHFSYYENSSGDDDSDTATEGEEEIRARELRKQEVRVEPPIDAGTDTEVASCDTTSESSSEIQNSATEISTDSEFAHDDPTPTRETPKKIFDGFVTKTRGVGGIAYHHHHQSQPKKVQVKSSMLQQPMNGRTPASATKDIELKFTPLVTATPLIRKPAPSSLLFSRSNEGYALNRTQSTGGIATKVSLELKKKYLLGEMNPSGGIQKSGSASTLDSKFKSFHTNITDCQKMLKPASEISASMQAFCNKLSERTSPLSPTFGLITKEKSSPNLNLSSELLHKAGSPKMEITKCMSASSIPEIIETNVVNETEGRPRSPLHEKQIIVPVIDWFKMKQKRESDYVDSLSSDSDSDEVVMKRPHVITNIPRLEITDDSGTIVKDAEEIAFDSLNESINYNDRISTNDVPKSITSERKTLNQPKILPDLENDSVLPDYHSALHTKPKITEESKTKELESKSLKDSSGRSTPSLNDDIGTTALTETELDDFEDVEYELISDIRALNSSNEQIKNKADNLKTVGVARIPDFGRDSKVNEANKSIKSTSGITECVNILSLNIDNIEFMDTGTEETSSDENHVLKNNGYIQFHNEDDFAEDSLSPALNIIETVNPAIETFNSNAEHTASSQKLVEEDRIDSSACDLKLANENMLDKAKLVCDNEDDSILIVETGTTTEENTCSDSTVKNITEKISKINGDQTNVPTPVIEEPPQIQSEAFEKEEDEKSQQNGHHHEDFTEFEEHCQRLQSKFEFSNVKDSLDIRRTRRRSKPDITKPDLIQEEKDKAVVCENQSSTKLSKKEEIEKERSMNQKLVQEMVMNKMRAQNKSLERKKRVRNSFSPIRPFELSKSATTDLSRQNKDLPQLTTATTPDVLLSIINSPLQKSQSTILSDISPLKEKSPPIEEPKSESATYNLPDVSKTSTEILFQTPRNPPRKENEEARKTAEKFKESARARCRLLSDEELGLSPEDKLIKLRQKVALRKNRDSGDFDVRILDSIESLVINTDRRNSLHYSNDTLKRNTSFRRSKSGDATSMTTPNTELVAKLSVKVDSNQRSQPMRTKSVSEINRFSHTSIIDLNIDNNNVNMCKSDPNLVMPNKKHHTKKPKDRERRKSITKMIAELFTKKKDSTNSTLTPSKSFLSRISPKIKNKSKEKIEDATLKRNSISEINLRRDSDGNVSPPPIPPLPVNYVRRHSLKDESSDAENEFKQDLGSCDTLDQSDAQMASVSNCPSKKLNRSARKTARQAQLKRHRTAQEIQRKLEETEVKTRELELRGVQVEKALRGESNGSFADDSKEESDLLKEWFDLMRDRTELRRYEKELMVRAQELELEDRHARLQHELRERLENDEPKTKEEMEIERDIIKEMMEIVAKRDSLINLLEEDRLRYFEEDRDFEEQILTKGIHLTPLVKTLDEK